MNRCINGRALSLKTKQWLWFLALWCGGLAGVTALSYPIKLLIRFMR